MKYNCCQQPGLCPKNKICKPINSPQQPWKRFICESCPEGYHGETCNEPIMSCRGYANGSRISGMYKIVGFNKSVYEVYCYFDSDGAWTLVQSYSFANGSDNAKFRKPLSLNFPISENNLAWNGYRLGKARMESIEKSSKFLRFTCEHKKFPKVEESDYIQILLRDLKVDVLAINGYTDHFQIQRGKIGQLKLDDGCLFYLYQFRNTNLYALAYLHTCAIVPSATTSSCNSQSFFSLFGHYQSDNACFEKTHGCVNNNESTTQLWFGY